MHFSAFPEGFLSFFLFRHLLFLSHDHFLNHFSTDRASPVSYTHLDVYKRQSFTALIHFGTWLLFSLSSLVATITGSKP